jgi:hypothetical protein
MGGVPRAGAAGAPKSSGAKLGKPEAAVPLGERDRVSLRRTGAQKQILHVVVCQESWEAIDGDSPAVVQKTTRHARISSVLPSPENVHERCNLGARHRWGIEEGILVEKHHGYGYEHRSLRLPCRVRLKSRRRHRSPSKSLRKRRATQMARSCNGPGPFCSHKPIRSCAKLRGTSRL